MTEENYNNNIPGRGLGRGGGRGLGRGGGQGLGRGGGRGRQTGGFGLGPSGECVCPKCGAKITHRLGVPCYEEKCPKCGSVMTRSN